MTADDLQYRQGVPVLMAAPDGPTVRTDGDALSLIVSAGGQGAELVVVPIERLDDEFFELSTGLAGAIAQKFVNYRLRLAILGDISDRTATSKSLREFVAETNHGRQLWFVADTAELDERLAAETDRR
jgi:hypothetical protein